MDNVEVVRVPPDAAVIALHGEHDVSTREEICSLLSAEVSSNALVVVDVTDADFIDSSVLHNLAKVDRLARNRGSRFVLQMGTAPIVRSAIEISGILGSIEWAGTREGALAGPTHNALAHAAAVTADG